MPSIVRTEPRRDATLVRLSGSLRAERLDAFADEWEAARLTGNVVVELSDLSDADESALAFLAEAGRRLRRSGGSLATCGAQGAVRNALFVSGLLGLLSFHDDEASAFGSLHPSAAAASDAPSESEIARLERVLAFLTEQAQWHRAAGIAEVAAPLEKELRTKQALFLQLHSRRSGSSPPAPSVASPVPASTRDPSRAATGAPPAGRRQAPRYRVNVTATLELSERTELAVVRNLSESGAGIGCNLQLPVAARIPVRLMNVAGIAPVRLAAEVRWCRRTGQVGAFDWSAGVRFLGESTPELALLRPAVRALEGKADEVPWT